MLWQEEYGAMLWQEEYGAILWLWKEKLKCLLQQELVLTYISFLPLWCCTAQFAYHILVVTEFLTFI